MDQAQLPKLWRTLKVDNEFNIAGKTLKRYYDESQAALKEGREMEFAQAGKPPIIPTGAYKEIFDKAVSQKKNMKGDVMDDVLCDAFTKYAKAANLKQRKKQWAKLVKAKLQPSKGTK